MPLQAGFIRLHSIAELSCVPETLVHRFIITKLFSQDSYHNLAELDTGAHGIQSDCGRV
jgi:hypothetical protein